LEITTAREAARGVANGGYIGLSRWYAEETDANSHELYDFRVDTSSKSPPVVAQEIYDFITSNEPEVFIQ